MKNKKLFSVPYTENIAKTLKKVNKDEVQDIYFSDGLLNSARNIQLTPSQRKELISLKDDYNLNYTFNPSFYDNKIYLENGFKDLISKIEILKEAYNIKMITFNNIILLKNKILRDKLFELDIEIRLSVNNKIDNLEKLKMIHKDLIIFDVVLDRSLNRNQDELNKCIDYAKSHGININLLLNEGCLPNCLYKEQCDLMISQYYKNTDQEVNELSAVHDILTCTSDFLYKPELSLKSPFISPLYIDNIPYVNYKIGGRNKDRKFLEKIILSYFKRQGDVKLRTFFSTHRHEIFSKINFYDLEEFNYWENTKNCKLQCHSCEYCDDVFKNLLN